MPRELLEGVKVCDFSRVIVGPLTTKTLSDYGAEVIRIESRKNLEIFRIQAQEPDMATQFTQWNTGKKGMSLDLTTEKGAEIAKKIVAWADIVVENYASGVIDRFGLGYEELKKVNPDIIMLSSCMQGQTGPYSRHPGWGFQLSALSGFSHITGYPDRPPPELGVYTDFITPQYNICLLIGALLYRRRTGKGMYIDTSQFETGLHFISPLLLDYFVNDRTAERMANRSQFAAPHGVFRCRDIPRSCTIVVNDDEEWEKFVGAMRNPEWAANPEFATRELREKNKEELHRLISAWAAERTVDEVLAAVQNPGLTAERLPQDSTQQDNVYHCQDEDRWCAIAVTTDEEWRSFCGVIGNPPWTQEDRFGTLAARKENEDELETLVEEWTKGHSNEEVMTLMQKAGVPAGIVSTGEDQIEFDPQNKHRNLFQEVEHPLLGKHHAVASPFHMSKTPCELRRSPLLGEHNEYVLKEICGLSDEEVVELVVGGVLE